MKIAYLDCFSGISGDMTLGALVDAGVSARYLRSELKKLGVSGYTVTIRPVVKKGIAATAVDVRVKPSAIKGRRHYPDIVSIIERSSLAVAVKEVALAIFARIAEAEAAVHATTLAKVHFHEVGAVDSIVDVVGAAVGFAALGVDAVEASPINVGSGTVETDHGVLPVPAPATLRILAGIPTYADGPLRELTTPTGAAIVGSLARRFGGQPPMIVERVGYGAGGYDLTDRSNVVRLTVGRTEEGAAVESLVELAATIDDMNPEAYGYAADRLFAAGAKDVTLTPVYMKKGRPGVVMTVLADGETAAALEAILFAETTTLGVRRLRVERAALPRSVVTVKTIYGPVKVKIARLPDGSVKAAPEYDDVARLAVKKKAPFADVYRAATAAALG
jgi:uncharacterized protein (TIGR00299 family) protein